MLDAIFSPELAEMAPNRRHVTLAVLASGNGSNFESLVEATKSGVLNADISVVVCNRPDAGVIRRAARLGVRSVVVDHRDFSSRAEFDAAVAEILMSAGVQWVAMAGWMRIATSRLLEPFEGRIVNLHPSLLPSFPGKNAIAQSVAAGVGVVGCTAHIVSEELDSGPILAQAAIARRAVESLDELTARIHALEHLLFSRAVARAIELAET